MSQVGRAFLEKQIRQSILERIILTVVYETLLITYKLWSKTDCLRTKADRWNLLVTHLVTIMYLLIACLY